MCSALKKFGELDAFGLYILSGSEAASQPESAQRRERREVAGGRARRVEEGQGVEGRSRALKKLLDNVLVFTGRVGGVVPGKSRQLEGGKGQGRRKVAVLELQAL